MMRSRRGPLPYLRALAAFAVVAALAAGPAAARAGGQQPAAVDTTGLGTGPYARMSMLLEKTIFRVDVLTLEVRLGERETAVLNHLLSGEPAGGEERALSDSIASVALEARDAWARIEFLRGVSLGRFLDGIRENLREAEDAGIITSDRYDTIASDLPDWYAFLEERGIRDGDRMFYRIRGDSLHTVYTSEDGERLLDQVDVGPERRLAVLGGYFAPGSDFRDGLVESVLRQRSRGGSR